MGKSGFGLVGLLFGVALMVSLSIVFLNYWSSDSNSSIENSHDLINETNELKESIESRLNKSLESN